MIDLSQLLAALAASAICLQQDDEVLVLATLSELTILEDHIMGDHVSARLSALNRDPA